MVRWSGAGKFVFTSSGGVYAEDDGQAVDEGSPVSDSARAQKLLECERAVLAEGGTVVRLAGLYSLERGAHNYWCKVGSVDGRPDGLIGLVSYDDAAGSVLSALSADKDKVAGEIFLICDGQEQSREDICKVAPVSST
jgi:nucleoside-diphosphate-sugar epimerase